MTILLECMNFLITFEGEKGKRDYEYRNINKLVRIPLWYTHTK